MQTQRIDLYDYFKIERPQGGGGYLTTYIWMQAQEHCKNRRRPAILILPGGGYDCISQREGEPIALTYMSKGYNAFVLEYSLQPIHYPTQLIEACMAVAYVRENADSLHVDKNQLAAIGFSAGGHLCGMLATMTGREEVKKALPKYFNNLRPNAVLYCYPVVTSVGKTHQRTIVNISGNNRELYDYVSVDKAVDKNSAPAFIWTTVDDDCVPSENSLLLAMAYKQADVPFELHMYRHGRHGLSLATRETANYPEVEPWIAADTQSWVDLSLTWLKSMGFQIIK